MKRLLVRLVAIALVAVGLFYLGGGWYFSGRIEAAGLEVRHSEPDRSLRVVGVAGDTITLVETGDDVPALDDPSTYGLAWDGGYGQVSGPADEGAGGEVTRHLTLLDGERPGVGDLAGLERDAFPLRDPAIAVGDRVRDVSYTSPAGSFPAWLVPGHGTTWAIFTHGGLGTTRAEALRAMATTVDLGMPSMAITYRNDEGVPADPGSRYAYGRTEWRDLEGAVRYALDHGAQHVVLVGYSMGGAITASFLQHSPLASHVSRVVLDAPMLDFGGTVDYAASQQHLPLIGRVPQSLAWTARQIAAVRYDVDWRQVDYLDDREWLTVPALVFHGDEDTRVPLSTSKSFAHDHRDLVTLVVVPDAGHVEAWNEDPGAYDRALRAFVGQP